MAYINIAQWSPGQVVEWLKGLDISMYIDAFANNRINGDRLLHLRSSDLEELGIYCIGHQEIILEAVEHLRNFHFNLDKENLQFLAVQVATSARSLYKQLERNREKKTLDTEALMDITRTLAKIKPLICWLDRPPFKGQQQYLEIRKKMLTLALEMAISAQRDRFALKPVEQIIQNAVILAKLSDYIIQVITDPMLLQPASLILVTLKKRECDLGFYVSPSFHGIYRVTDIKLNSPAHISGKIEEGDEVVQINYQTVIGWQHKRVLMQLHDSKPDVVLTMKKRPKHVKMYGQIYMKPYRLPSKKNSMAVRWGEASSPILSRPLELLPSVRIHFRSAKTDPEPIPEDHVDGGPTSQAVDGKHEDSDSELLTPTAKLPDHELHLLFQTSRPFLQRRNTICGDQSSESFKYLSNVKFWQDRREKSFSMGFGLENTAVVNKQNQSQQATGNLNLNGSMPDILTTTSAANNNSTGNERKAGNGVEENSICDINKLPVITKTVRFDAAAIAEPPEDEKLRHLELSEFDAIPFADQTAAHGESPEDSPVIKHSPPAFPTNVAPIVQQRTNFPPRTARTTPAIADDDQPPAIEPRKEQQVAPPPPPRPKKPIEMSPSGVAPVPPPKPLESPSALKPVAARVPAPDPPREKEAAPGVEPAVGEVLELVTPLKQKSLTLKKKNSILAKRRKIAVKALPHSDIQGHLYRRTKGKSDSVYWAKGYFVLADNALYCFRAKDAPKAHSLVFVSGFTVCLASEIHSRPFAFKVYYATKTLYLAAESQEALTQWMEYLRRATMTRVGDKVADIKEVFTETESSEEDSEGSGEHGEHAAAQQPEVVKQEKYHLGLGPLKFPNPFSSHKNPADKKKSDLPIPTVNFKTYIKVHGYAGLPPGNHFFPPDNSILPPASSSTPLSTPGYVDEKIRPPIVSPITPGGGGGGGGFQQPPMTKSSSQPPVDDPPPPTPAPRDDPPPPTRRSPSKKFQPHNYIHASNPNLVDFECQLGEKPSQFSYETSGSLMNASGSGGVTVNGTNGAHSLQGCMTLMDLMLQQQADDAKEVYNNRVFLGEEKEDDQRRRKQRNDSQRSENHLKINYGGGGDQKIDKIQRRTLPKTPDYAQSFKPDDVDILMIRTKEGQSLRNFGYEFISEEDPPQPSSGTASAAGGGVSGSSSVREKGRPGKKSDKVSPSTSWSRNKGRNWINNSSDKGHGSGTWEGTGSFKKQKGLKFDSIKSADRFFSFNKIVGGGYDTRKASSPGQSPSHLGASGGNTLPLGSGGGSGKKGNLFNLSDGGVLGGTKKVNPAAAASSASFDGSSVSRKLSSASTASYLSKLSFSGSGRGGGAAGSAAGGGGSGTGVVGVGAAKEKKIFGSPRLHRAIFGKTQHTNSPGNRSPIFDEVILGQGTPSWMDTRREPAKAMPHNMPDVVATGTSSGGVSPGGMKSPKAPEYPGMECPPVFRPETYSLSDPSTSNTLRRRNNLNNKKGA